MREAADKKMHPIPSLVLEMKMIYKFITEHRNIIDSFTIDRSGPIWNRRQEFKNTEVTQ